MRLLLIIVGAFVAIVCIEKPAEAQSYPWCANYNRDGGATNCGFSTYQQCMATVSGFGGSCGENPRYQGQAGPYTRYRGAIIIERLSAFVRAMASATGRATWRS